MSAIKGTAPNTAAFLAHNKAHSISTTDMVISAVFENLVYAVAKRFEVPSSAVGGGIVNIVVDTTGCTCDHLIVLPLIFKAFDAGPIFIDIYFGTITTPGTGTEWKTINRNHNFLTLAKLKYWLNPTITADGVKFDPEYVIYSNGVPATASLGGESKDDFLFLARTDGQYLIRLTNQEANTALAHFSSNHLEL